MSSVPAAPKIPTTLGIQRVPLNAVLATALISEALMVGAVIAEAELWMVVGLAVIPWIPLFAFEAIWKYENYGFYTILLGFTLLQLGHLGEHTAQIMQLFFTGGDATKAHGVFGALDRELVHFAWDSMVWLGVLFLIFKMGPRNKWLWISLIAASFHEVEHIFLFYLDRFQPEFYASGGTTGILAKGGMNGTPLQRPYLHYVYNFVVVVPLVMALWDETKYAYNRWLAKALPSLSDQEKVSATTQLEAMKFESGEEIVRQGEISDRFYVISDGQVEVVRQEPGGEQRVAVLGPGQFFGEMGLVNKQPRTATVRALKDTEVLALEADEFTMLVTRSKGASSDIDAELHQRLAELKQTSG